MIARIIRFSITNRVFVLLAAVVLAVWGTWAVKNTPVDALPDLSDVLWMSPPCHIFCIYILSELLFVYQRNFSTIIE